jgi:Fe-S cluster assembly iron-binding protein IscA
MLNVTERAADMLQQKLIEHGDDSAEVLRLQRQDAGIGLAIDREAEGDEVVEHDGRPLLAIDSDLARELDGAKIDLVDTPEGPRLTFIAAGS